MFLRSRGEKSAVRLMTLQNIYNIPTGAPSDVLKDVATFLPCSHVMCYLAQDLTAWGFALCPQFHMIKCVSVHKYANVSSSLSFNMEMSILMMEGLD